MFCTISAYPHLRARFNKTLENCSKTPWKRTRKSNALWKRFFTHSACSGKPFGCVLAPRLLPDGSQKAPKTAQVTPNIPQTLSKRPQRLPKSLPKSAQDPARGPRDAPRVPREAPKTTQEVRKTPQEVPKRSLRGPKTPPRPPKRPQRRPKGHLRLIAWKDSPHLQSHRPCQTMPLKLIPGDNDIPSVYYSIHIYIDHLFGDLFWGVRGRWNDGVAIKYYRSYIIYYMLELYSIY